MSSGLGKSYNHAPDQTTKRKSGVKKESTTQEGSTDFGRSLPLSGQTGSGNQSVGSRKKENGKYRKNQPARQPLSSALREQVFNRYHYKCSYCEASPLTDKRVRLEVAHIVPVSRGGTNDPHNLQTLCNNCNKSKSAS